MKIYDKNIKLIYHKQESPIKSFSKEIQIDQGRNENAKATMHMGKGICVYIGIQSVGKPLDCNGYKIYGY